MVNLSPTGKIATSLILKDAVGCYLYVTQARSNKKFEPKQRADIANYDLANGVINIALQLAAVKPIENLMTKVVDSKMMKKMFYLMILSKIQGKKNMRQEINHILQ